MQMNCEMDFDCNDVAIAADNESIYVLCISASVIRDVQLVVRTGKRTIDGELNRQEVSHDLDYCY